MKIQKIPNRHIYKFRQTLIALKECINIKKKKKKRRNYDIKPEYAKYLMGLSFNHKSFSSLSTGIKF